MLNNELFSNNDHDHGHKNTHSKRTLNANLSQSNSNYVTFINKTFAVQINVIQHEFRTNQNRISESRFLDLRFNHQK